MTTIAKSARPVVNTLNAKSLITESVKRGSQLEIQVNHVNSVNCILFLLKIHRHLSTIFVLASSRFVAVCALFFLVPVLLL